jgi:DNA processing protein
VIRLDRSHPDYPRKLRNVAGAPDPIWLWGTLPPTDVRTVGIVGTRRLTPLGTRIARLVSMALARAGAAVVSGLAQGVDSVAHVGALDAGGRTIAVLGEGLAHFDERGPLRRRHLAKRVRAQGALVSEYPLDTHPSAWTFPKRNRTIAGLSDVLIVVEAPRDSGALITADEMRGMGRPVYIVAGPLDAPTWQGSNDYIVKRRGQILLSLQEVAGYLGLTLSETLVAAPVDDAQDRLVAFLSAEPADTDAVAAALGISPVEAATLLAEQLISGGIVSTPDGRFARK